MKILTSKDLIQISGGVCERADEENFIVFNCQGLDDYPKEITRALQTMRTENKPMNINWEENKDPYTIRLSWWWCFKDKNEI